MMIMVMWNNGSLVGFGRGMVIKLVLCITISFLFSHAFGLMDGHCTVKDKTGRCIVDSLCLWFYDFEFAS